MKNELAPKCPKCKGAKAFYNSLSQDVDVCPECEGVGHTNHMLCGIWGKYYCEVLAREYEQDLKDMQEYNSDEVYQEEKIEGVAWATSHDPMPYDNWRI